MTRAIALLPAPCPSCGDEHVPVRAGEPCGACAALALPAGARVLTAAEVMRRRALAEGRA